MATNSRIVSNKTVYFSLLIIQKIVRCLVANYPKTVFQDNLKLVIKFAARRDSISKTLSFPRPTISTTPIPIITTIEIASKCLSFPAQILQLPLIVILKIMKRRHPSRNSEW